uniref:Uncharacterized protein n=1 Tax=Oryza meridionalis TaxID=40149 RepID=A0A0E0EJK9_9ORYZ
MEAAPAGGPSGNLEEGGGWIGARRLEEADGDVALRRGSTHRLFFNCFRCPSIYLRFESEMV